jgi:POT family proton-dependent oligopeptide transporter
MTNGLKLKAFEATSITASFVAFNYALHLIGGFITGRLFSHRSLFAFGMLLQAIGCIFLSINNLYFGLALFLAGAGLNVTCINCILTQVFEPNDTNREKAFLFNYSAMNIGFLIGFTISGFFEKIQNYSMLFIFAAIANILTFLIVLVFFKNLKDRGTLYNKLSSKKKIYFKSLGLLMIFSIILMLHYLLRYANVSNYLIIFTGVIMAFVIIYFAIKQKTVIEKEKMFAFLILCIMSIFFWTLYMSAPMGLTIFIEKNVNRQIFNFTIEPQWVLNINTIIIIIGGPLMAFIYKKLRRKGFNISIPIQFTLALFLIGVAFVILPFGIALANKDGYVNFSWILFSYILQSIGELCLSPIGYAMIGQLIPKKLQSIMMGTWLMLTGISAVFSNIFSKFAINVGDMSDPIKTNPMFSKTFYILGISTLIAGIIMLCLVSFLHKLIKEKKHPTNTSSIPV